MSITLSCSPEPSPEQSRFILERRVSVTGPTDKGSSPPSRTSAHSAVAARPFTITSNPHSKRSSLLLLMSFPRRGPQVRETIDR